MVTGEELRQYDGSNPKKPLMAINDRSMTSHKSFEELNPRAMTVVIDPMKSVNENFVIDAFRTYTRSSETTSNVGSLHGRFYYQYKSIYGNPFFRGFAPGADSWYYSILISHRKNDLEIQMLKSMDRKSRTHSSNLKDFTVRPFSDVAESNKKGVEKQVQEESDVPPENPAVVRVGRVDAEKRLEEIVRDLMYSNPLQIVGMVLLCVPSEFNRQASIAPTNCRADRTENFRTTVKSDLESGIFALPVSI